MKQPLFFEFSFGKVSVIDNEILFTEYYSNEKFDLKQAKELDGARYNLCNGNFFFSLVSLESVFGHMTKEAQYYLANKSKCSKLIKHEVVIVDSLSIRILVKYFVKFTKPPYMIEVVKNYLQGIDLLKSIIMDRDNHNQS